MRLYNIADNKYFEDEKVSVLMFADDIRDVFECNGAEDLYAGHCNQQL